MKITNKDKFAFLLYYNNNNNNNNKPEDIKTKQYCPVDIAFIALPKMSISVTLVKLCDNKIQIYVNANTCLNLVKHFMDSHQTDFSFELVFKLLESYILHVMFKTVSKNLL